MKTRADNVSQPTASQLGGVYVVYIDVGVDAGLGKFEIFLQIHAPFWAYKNLAGQRERPAHLVLRNAELASAQEVAYSLLSYIH